MHSRVSAARLLQRELTGPASEPRLPRWPRSVYVAKLLDTFPRLVWETVFTVLKGISYILEHLGVGWNLNVLSAPS